MTDHDSNVAIFWDYENCTPSCTAPGYDIVENIRQIAHKYGSVKLFKAYLEISEQPSANSNRLRSELQSCGVSLTDCPHNGRKDVADKMMIVDMLTYAIDTSAPATLVVISGDRDFVYAISVLRWRKYHVVLVAPNNTHGSLKSQASTILDWEVDVLGKTARDSTQKPNGDGIARTPNTIGDMHRRAQFSATSTLFTTPDVPQVSRRLSFRGSIPPTQGVESLQSPASISIPQTRVIHAHSSLPADHPLVTENPSLIGSTQADLTASDSPSMNHTHEADPSARRLEDASIQTEPIMECNSKDHANERSFSDRVSSDRITPSATSNNVQSESLTTRPTYATSCASETVLSADGSPDTKHGPCVDLEAPRPCSAPPVFGCNGHGVTPGSPIHDINSAENIEDRSLSSTIAQPGLPAGDRDTIDADDPLGLRSQSTHRSNNHATTVKVPPCPVQGSRVPNRIPTTLSPSVPSTTQLSPVAPSQQDVPNRFVPLVWSLQRACAMGVEAPVYHLFGDVVLRQFPNAYEVAGVRCWEAYIALAQIEGIVNVWGPKANPWISLTLVWRGRMSSACSLMSSPPVCAAQPQPVGRSGRMEILKPLVRTKGSDAGCVDQAAEPADILHEVTTLGITPSTPQNDQASNTSGTTAAFPSQASSPTSSSRGSAAPQPQSEGFLYTPTTTAPQVHVATNVVLELPPVPNQYMTLIQLLEKHRAAGVLQPLRTVIAVALTQRDRNAYRLAGATRWREYANMAVKDGIINLGGLTAGPWVSLEPAWYDRAPRPSW